MNQLEKNRIVARANFVRKVREYIWNQGLVELDTPGLKPIPSMEPYLDPFEVVSPSREEKGYLISSPEYSIKQALANGVGSCFEIAHVFRSGEKGSPFHTPEFLMLEIYLVQKDLNELIRFMHGFLDEMIAAFSRETVEFHFLSLEKLVMNHTGRGWSKPELQETIREKGLSLGTLTEQYEDLFYLVFLNCIEPNLPKGISFVTGYPPEMAALSRVIDGRAERFEIYWGRVELANAFYELRDPEEQVRRFESEQVLRQSLGKEVFPIDSRFIEALEIGLPDCSGIALGLDRLFCCLLGLESLQECSPYFHVLSPKNPLQD